MQLLKQKKAEKAKQNWKNSALQTSLLRKAVGVFQVAAKDSKENQVKMTKAESKMAHEMAQEVSGR